MAMNFADYAAVSPEEIPEATLLPQGTYIWAVSKPYEQKTSASGNGTLINFLCKIRNPIDDFEDPEALDDFPGGVEGEARMLMFFYPETPNKDEDDAGLSKRQDRAMRDLSKFLTSTLGLEAAPINQMLTMATNATFLGTIKHEQDNRDKSILRDTIGSHAPLL